MKSELLTRDSEPATPNPRRSRRIYVYWGIPFALLLVLGLICWVVVPVLRVSKVVKQVARGETSVTEGPRILGSARTARWALRWYLSRPKTKCPHRRSAVQMLTFCGKDSIRTLEELLSHSERDIRQAAAEGLGLWKADRSVGPLIAALRDSDYMVRRAAARAMGDIGDRRGVPALTNALSDENAMVRYAAAEALGQMGTDAAAAIPALEKCLSDKGQWEGFVIYSIYSEKYRAGESVGPQTLKVADAAAEALKNIRGKAAKPE